jgi:hypothetical protein
MMFGKYLETGDRKQLARMEDVPYRGLAGSELSIFRPLFDAACKQMEEFRGGQITAAQAADRIFALLADADFLPPHRFADPAARCTGPFTALPAIRTYFWGRFRAPKVVRDTFVDFTLLPVVRMSNRILFVEFRRSLRTSIAMARDCYAAWNNEWKDKRHDPPAPAMPVAHGRDSADGAATSGFSGRAEVYSGELIRNSD